MLFLDIIKTTLESMGYELVEFEKTTYGLLRIYLDFPFKGFNKNNRNIITIKDCEKVTYQLLHILKVENINYTRLEVSSPGLNRSLKKLSDYFRFADQEAIIKLRMPILKFSNRKLFQGTLRLPKDEKLKLEFKTNDGLVAILNFILSDVDTARLVPKVDFRSRKT